jgi:hypothetical protein
MLAKRPPTPDDLLLVFAELDRAGVEYALLGGAAMALHGFPRMTKDIDCIFPRDAANNQRLMTALGALGQKVRLDYLPQLEWLDQGFSTAAEGEIGLDILFVAAGHEFGDYRQYIETREINGVPVRVLNIDGMLLSKQTDRPEDIPDRNRLRRLKPDMGRG